MPRSKQMIYVIVTIALIPLLFFTWRLTAGDKYESAEYSVVTSDGKFEVREYPELAIASTSMKSYGDGRDGSFMRLFRYISGESEAKQKIAMTTPVFMEAQTETDAGQMAFVLPNDVAEKSAPNPVSESVEVGKRPAGKYAVIRFNGYMDQDTISNAEQKLRGWMEENNLQASEELEFAGYDPPWTPGLLRRNEVLIRVGE